MEGWVVEQFFGWFHICEVLLLQGIREVINRERNAASRGISELASSWFPGKDMHISRYAEEGFLPGIFIQQEGTADGIVRILCHKYPHAGNDLKTDDMKITNLTHLDMNI